MKWKNKVNIMIIEIKGLFYFLYNVILIIFKEMYIIVDDEL